ncbi:MAG: zinc-dependent metalloprotease [Spartobacteria bacterium]
MLGVSCSGRSMEEGKTLTKRDAKRPAIFARKMRRLFLAIVLACLLSSTGRAAPKNKPNETKTKPRPSIAEKTRGMQAMPGYFNLYWDARAGKVWLEIDKFETDFLYVASLAAGVGSNDIGLDRGQFGDLESESSRPEHLVKFERSGPKVLLVEQNLAYRAVTKNADEKRSVEEAFARSVLWGFKVEAEEKERVLVDATPFLLNDAHGVADKLQAKKQGTYKIDDTRSAIYLPLTKNFPKNTEFEATLTFVGEPAGDWIRSVTPTAKAVTVREHHSFVELPDDQYQPRLFDPRSGFYALSYADYATPIPESLVKRFITRHRLRKKDPQAASSEPVEPIIYYVDRGAPEPVKSALIEGASWWNQAFEAAGYKDAFQVKELPEGVDPMDLRYNVIEWIHRSTRGWSYGMSIIDPRTGEIIKGHVSLGSLRVRQDFLLAQGLVEAYASSATPDPRLLELSLARLRQLAAHEVGHTLGLQHNFAASTQNRASVMDYPPPVTSIDDKGNIDLSQAYATGIGAWDKRTILYGYQDFPVETDESDGLAAVLQENIAKGFRYLTDADARPPGSANPFAHLWDSGASATEELNRLMKVRALALSRLSEKNIPPGAPMATLEKVLVPVYLMHRFQAEAATKLIGGVNYTYAARGDGQPTNEPLPAEQQRAALTAVLQTLRPDFLEMPAHLVALLPPPPPGYARDRESFDSHAGMIFDPQAAAESWIETELDLLLSPARLTRIVAQNAQAPKGLSLNEIFDATLQTAERTAGLTGPQKEIARAVEKQFLNHLLELALNHETEPQVNAYALQRIADLETKWKARLASEPAEQAHNAYLLAQIEQFRRDPKALQIPKPPRIPDGSPIGADE